MVERSTRRQRRTQQLVLKTPDFLEQITHFGVYLGTVNNGYYEYKSGPWYIRLLAKLLRRRRLYICQEIESEGLVRSLMVDVPSLLRFVKDQIALARANGNTVTKIIMGPETFKQFHDENLSDLRWMSIKIPQGIPLIEGLELIINPCIEGVAVG